MRLLNHDTLKKVVDDPWADFEECYGNKTYLFHRIDLHSGLREMAEAPESKKMPGKPVEIRLGCPTAQVNVEDGLITVQDGTQFEKDFIVIADGVKVKQFRFSLVFRAKAHFQLVQVLLRDHRKGRTIGSVWTICLPHAYSIREGLRR